MVMEREGYRQAYLMTNSMKATTYKVLLVEDQSAAVKLTKYALAEVPDIHFHVEHADSLTEAVAQLQGGMVDVALVDLALPDSNGFDTFRALRLADPNVAIVILTGLEDEQLALAMLKQGAQDYLLKTEVNTTVLGRSLRYAIERHRSAAQETLNEQLTRTQESLTATVARLELANDDLAQFTYFFSHDLQEPLRKLTHFTKLLKEDIGHDLNEPAQHDIEFITDAARSMQGLVTSLLTLSRAGQAALEWGPVNLEECVAEALSRLTAHRDTNEAEVSSDPLPTIFGDMTMLAHVYQNLIGNALKYTNGHRPQIRLTAEQEDKSWILGVRDNGIGIPIEFVEHSGSATRRSTKGQAWGSPSAKK
jgi:signal transduction histidine kinase